LPRASLSVVVKDGDIVQLSQLRAESVVLDSQPSDVFLVEFDVQAEVLVLLPELGDPLDQVLGRLL
jgi:hypothetical protein